MTQQPAISAKSTKWLKIAFGVSLGLNLLVAGLVAGAWFGGKGLHGGHRSGSMGLRPYISALPVEGRKMFFKEMKNNRKNFHDAHGRTDQKWQSVVQAIKAQPFDRKVVEMAFQNQRDLMMNGAAFAQVGLLNYLEGLTDDKRAAYAERLDKHHKRRGRWKKHKD